MKNLLITLLMLAAVVGGFAQPVSRSFTIVAFGTSLTEASAGSLPRDDQWESLLQEMLRQRHPNINITVINAGIGGSSTRDRLPRLQKEVIDRHPDLVIHDFAANDANYDLEHHVYLDEFERNIQTMHDQVVSKTGAAEIYWPQTPVIDSLHVWRKQPLFVEAGGLDKYAERYRKATAQMSRRLHVPFVDMDAIFRKAIKSDGAGKYILPDGIHHSKEGNRLVAEGLLPVVEKKMSELGFL